MGPLSVEEMNASRLAIVRHVQQNEYAKEISMLQTDEQARLLRVSSLQNLCPVLQEGVLRVGGRLENAEVDYEVKHPVIIPGKHRVAELVIREYHQSNGHVGLNMMKAMIRQEFWITQITAAVRRVLSDCFICKRNHQAPCRQRMAPLPAERLVADHPPFTFVGVDYFGPMLVVQGRSHVKRYACLFTCLTTRAVHVEIAHSLDTESFLAAFSRFVSRRGRPSKVFSDNGTNFTSAEKELRGLVSSWNQSSIHGTLLQKNVEWHFNPPGASHMGGVWERVVQSVKRILKVLLHETLVNDETLTTLMCEVEKILNDRPITPCSDDVRDPEPLTPNKLLLLKGNSSLPPGVFDKRDGYFNRRFKTAHLLADKFWSRWLTEYIPLLQERSKWYDSVRNLEVGDVVLMCEDNAPRGQWPMGVVEETHQGSDGLVRSAKIRIGQSYKVRPITKLCLLEQCSK